MNVDVGCKEQYLADDEFAALFGASKENFLRLPKWKQARAKKEHGLF